MFGFRLFPCCRSSFFGFPGYVRPFAVSLLLLGCEHPNRQLVAEAPLISTTYQDDTRQAFRFFEPPGRLVLLSPSLVDLVQALGGADRIVAVSDRSLDFAQQHHLPALTSYPDSAFDWQGLKSLVPSLVIATDDQYEGVPYWREQAAQQGIPWFYLKMGSLSKVFAHIETLGRLVGKPAEATDLAQRMRGFTQAMRGQWAGKRKPRAVLLINQQPLVALGAEHYLTDMVEAAGAELPLARAGERYVTLTDSQLVAAQPDILFMVTADPGYFNALLRLYPSLIHLPAVVQKRLIALPPSDYLHPGTNIPALLINLAGVAWPEVQLNDLYHRFFGQPTAR
ncbi:MAG: ABC transporter substrate-binding protein [Bacteroidetes bacterium]|jgi:iron complex transport system substrate-binding protein|nr:ABC transporter substrate-binding protein [Bacteroidota bacterium]